MQCAPSSKLCAAASTLAALAIGCGSSQSEPAAPVAEPPATAAEAEPESFDSPFELIPADAYLVLTGDSLTDVAELVGWKALRQTEGLALAAAQVEETLGRDLLSVSVLAELGVATDEPVGLAIVPGERDAAMLLARLSSKQRFVDELETIAAQRGVELERGEVGPAELIAFPPASSEPASAFDVRTRFVIRGDHLLVVEGAELADAVATGEVAASLARAPAFERAMDAVDASGQVFGYAAVRSILETALGGAFGPPPALATLLDSIGFSGVGFSAAARGDRLELSLALPAREDAPPPLLRRGEGAPAIVRALDREPLALVSLNLDVDGALARISRAAGASALEQGKAFAGQAFGVDIDAEVLPLLSGELGLAWTGASSDLYRDDAPTDDSALDGFDIHATLGVRDTAAAAELLERLADSPLVDTLVEPREGGGVTIPIPGWKPVHIDARAGTLAATTAPEVLKRLADGDSARSYADSIEPEDHRELLLAKDAAAVASLAVEALATMILADPIDPRVLDLEPAKEGSDDDPHRARLDDLDEELERATELAQVAQQSLAELLVDFGTITLALRAEPQRVVARGGHFFAEGETLASLLARFVEADAELTRLENTAFQLSMRRVQLMHELEVRRQGAE